MKTISINSLVTLLALLLALCLREDDHPRLSRLQECLMLVTSVLWGACAVLLLELAVFKGSGHQGEHFLSSQLPLY